MTFKEVLEWLDTHVLGNLEIKAKLTTAVEKQIPKEVEMKKIEVNQSGLYIAFCPECGKMVRGIKAGWCYNCGQKLEWREMKNDL